MGMAACGKPQGTAAGPFTELASEPRWHAPAELEVDDNDGVQTSHNFLYF